MRHSRSRFDLSCLPREVVVESQQNAVARPPLQGDPAVDALIVWSSCWSAPICCGNHVSTDLRLFGIGQRQRRWPPDRSSGCSVEVDRARLARREMRADPARE